MKISEVKQKAIDALGTIDLSKLNLNEISMFVGVLNGLSLIREDDELSNMMKDLYSKIPLNYEPVKSPIISDLTE